MKNLTSRHAATGRSHGTVCHSGHGPRKICGRFQGENMQRNICHGSFDSDIMGALKPGIFQRNQTDNWEDSALSESNPRSMSL